MRAHFFSRKYFRGFYLDIKMNKLIGKAKYGDISVTAELQGYINVSQQNDFKTEISTIALMFDIPVHIAMSNVNVDDMLNTNHSCIKKVARYMSIN